MMRYRSIMEGTFIPFNKEYCKNPTTEELGITIPSPFIRECREDAERDSNLTYRFYYSAEEKEPVILVFPDRILTRRVDIHGKKHIVEESLGYSAYKMTYAEFRKSGGFIHTFPPEQYFPAGYENIDAAWNDMTPHERRVAFDNWIKETDGVEWNYKDHEIQATFADLFPRLQFTQKPVYISEGKYTVEEVVREQ